MKTTLVVKGGSVPPVGTSTETGTMPGGGGDYGP
jgi:hypothetical protein